MGARAGLGRAGNRGGGGGVKTPGYLEDADKVVTENFFSVLLILGEEQVRV